MFNISEGRSGLMMGFRSQGKIDMLNFGEINVKLILYRVPPI